MRICDEGVVEQLLEVARVVFGMSECPEVGGCPGGSARMSAAAAALPPPPPPSLLLLLLLPCRYSLLRAFHKTQNEKQSVETWLCSAIHRGSRSSSSTAAAQQQHSSSSSSGGGGGGGGAAAAAASSPSESRAGCCVVSPLPSVCVLFLCLCILVVPRCPGCAVSASG